MEKILDQVNDPLDLKKLSMNELKKLSSEIREFILGHICDKGGHLASSLGAVELTVALHYVFNAPQDIILWDVGHQSYTHKILTGRKERFKTIREIEGLSGFPNKDESIYDAFTVGHSSTSISWALGMRVGEEAVAGDKKKRIVAVIGDAALGGGMALEALNHAGHLKKDLLVILNDNEHSISRTVGALSKYLNRITTSPIYNKIRKDVENLIKKIPRFGFQVYRLARRLEESLKNILVPGIIFEELGFCYFGPIDGHDLPQMITTISKIKDMEGPLLLHLITKKGKGYHCAEEQPHKFHSAPVFDRNTGEKKVKAEESFTTVFSNKLVELAGSDKKIVAITAAMPEGTGLDKFEKQYPGRFFDVGIAEEHAVGFAAGIARSGAKPVVAIYSTFLQRAYDQIIHDICLQNAHVIFAVDRAGLVGEDGPTHHGIFDIGYLRQMPKMSIMAPVDKRELEEMLELSIELAGPAAIRYPRDKIMENISKTKVEFGQAEVLVTGKDLLILAIGAMVQEAVDASTVLKKQGISTSVVNARFIKPIDEKLLLSLFNKIKKIVTVEEGVLSGGFGSRILEFIETNDIKNIDILRLGLPDKFIEHGPRDKLLERYGLTAASIAGTIRKRWL
ncbi:MAG: 1-deoxy-D-xylulose-5-phosphate synthase [Candidatus Omnitrophota bacterium]